MHRDTGAVRRTATLMFAAWDRKMTMRRTVPLTELASGHEGPGSRSRNGDLLWRGGGPVHGGRLAHDFAEGRASWMVGMSGDHLAHKKPASSRATAVATTLRELSVAVRRRRMTAPAAGRCGWDQADSTRAARRWTLPVLVIRPRLVRSPEEYSVGVSPQKP